MTDARKKYSKLKDVEDGNEMVMVASARRYGSLGSVEDQTVKTARENTAVALKGACELLINLLKEECVTTQAKQALIDKFNQNLLQINFSQLFNDYFNHADKLEKDKNIDENLKLSAMQSLLRQLVSKVDGFVKEIQEIPQAARQDTKYALSIVGLQITSVPTQQVKANSPIDILKKNAASLQQHIHHVCDYRLDKPEEKLDGNALKVLINLERILVALEKDIKDISDNNPSNKSMFYRFMNDPQKAIQTIIKRILTDYKKDDSNNNILVALEEYRKIQHKLLSAKSKNITDRICHLTTLFFEGKFEQDKTTLELARQLDTFLSQLKSKPIQRPSSIASEYVYVPPPQPEKKDDSSKIDKPEEVNNFPDWMKRTKP